MGKYEELEKIQKLRETGVIDDQEFAIEKAKILAADGMSSPSAPSVAAQPVIINNNVSAMATAISASGYARRMHWIYFILIGWWLGMTLICFIIPIFVPGLIKKAFGYW